jgi:hypothetical protein
LKTESQTWNDAFHTFNFSENQNKLIENFNLRYECIYARDDHSAKLQKSSENGIFTSWANQETLDELDASLADYDNDRNEYSDFNENAYLQVDPNGKYFKKQREMDKMEGIVHNVMS